MPQKPFQAQARRQKGKDRLAGRQGGKSKNSKSVKNQIRSVQRLLKVCTPRSSCFSGGIAVCVPLCVQQGQVFAFVCMWEEGTGGGGGALHTYAKQACAGNIHACIAASCKLAANTFADTIAACRLKFCPKHKQKVKRSLLRCKLCFLNTSKKQESANTLSNIIR